MIVTHKYKLKPSSSQQQVIKDWINMLRSHYNFCLRDRIEALAVSQEVTGTPEATGARNRDISEALASEPTNPLQRKLFEWMNGQVIGC